MTSTTTLRGITRTATTAVRSSPSMQMMVQQSASIWNRNPTANHHPQQPQPQPLRTFSSRVAHSSSENQELARMLLLLSPTPPNTHEGPSIRVGSDDNTSNSKAEARGFHNSNEPQEHPRKLKEEEISQFLW